MLLELPTGPCSSSTRRSLPYFKAALLKTLTKSISGLVSPKIASSPPWFGSSKKLKRIRFSFEVSTLYVPYDMTMSYSR